MEAIKVYEKLETYEETEAVLGRKARNFLYLSKAKVEFKLEAIQRATQSLEKAIDSFYIDEINFADFLLLSVFLNRLSKFEEAYLKENLPFQDERTLSFEHSLWHMYLQCKFQGKELECTKELLEGRTENQRSLICYLIGHLVKDSELKLKCIKVAYHHNPYNLAAAKVLLECKILKSIKTIEKLYENEISLIQKQSITQTCPIDFEFLPLGGGDDIGASCYFIRLGSKKLLVDVGAKIVGNQKIYPDFDRLEEKVPLSEINYVLITHAHLDHCGGIIKLYERNKNIIAVMTPETKELLRFNLASGLSLAEKMLLEELLKESMTCELDKSLWIDKDQIEFSFFRAGHILGAASLLIANEQGTVFVTGDYTTVDQRTVQGIQLPKGRKVDVLITEATCGNRQNERMKSRKMIEQQFAHYVTSKINEGKKVLIPAFAIGRVQEIIEILKPVAKENHFRLYIDGSAIEVGKIYERYGACKLFEQGIYEVPIKQYGTRENFVKQEFLTNRSCMVATSGMLQEGSSAIEYAKYILGRDDGVCILTGYQANDTIGAKLKGQMAQACERYIEIEEKLYHIKSELKEFNLSAHVGLHGILACVTSLAPQHVILVHGQMEEEKGELHRYLEQVKGLGVVQSRNGEEIKF